MGDQKRTKKQLIDELVKLRQRIAELEKSESEHKQVEEALRRSKAGYKEVAESIGDVFFAMDNDLKYTYWNKASENLTVISAKDAIGKSLYQLFPKAKGTEIEKFYLEVIRTHQPRGFTSKFWVGGKERVFEIGAYPSLRGLSVIAKDITDRVHAEEALRENQRLLEGLLESLPDAVFTIDSATSKVTDCNSAAVEIFGYGRDEMIGETTTFLHVDEGAFEEFRKALHSAIREKGFLHQFEFRMKRRDGRIFPSEHSVAPIEDSRGKRVGWVSVVRDITERKRAEEEIRQEKEFSERLISSTVDGILAFDRDCRFIVWNPGMESIFGIGKEEILGHRAFDLFPFLKGIGEDRFFSEALAGKTVVSKNRPYVVPEAGRHGFFEGYYSPLLDKSDEIIGGLAIIHDITERKRAEEALRESEEKYRLVVENAAEAIFVAQEGMVKFSNPRAAEIIGYSTEELTARPFEEFIHPDDRKRVLNRHLSRYPGENLPSVHPFRIISESGEARWVELNTVSITWENKPATLNFMSDVTERLRVEEALKESELRYRTLVEHSNDLISEVDSDARLLYLSPNHKNVIGYEPAERLGRNIFENVHPDDLPVILNAVETGKESGYSKVTYRYKHKNGRWIWLEASARIYLSKEGEQRAVVISRDITERKRAEEVLREKEVRFREMFENMNSGVAIYKAVDDGEDFVFTDINPAGARIGRRSREEMTRRSVQEVYPGVRNIDLLDVFKRVWRTGKPERHPVTRYQDDRVTIWVENYVCKLPSGEIVAIYEDITERKQAEEKVRLYEEQLRSLISELSLVEEEERRRIATDLHDHIGQTLALAKIKLESLRQMTSSTGLAMPLDPICEMIEQAIQYTRTLTFELSPPILYELGFEAAVEWLTEQIQEQHGILVSFEDDLQPKPMNHELRILLFKAVRELVINVVKHARARSAKVSIRRDGGHIHVLIRDDGYGFDPFKDNPTGKMSGFGLFSIRERLKHLGGSFEIESNPGHGTRVTLVAPLSG